MTAWSVGILALLLALTPALDADAACPVIRRRSAVVREFRRTHICPATGTITPTCPNYVVDHQIPLCAWGPDSISNMLYQPVAAAKEKDVLEKRLCARLRKCGCP